MSGLSDGVTVGEAPTGLGILFGFPGNGGRFSYVGFDYGDRPTVIENKILSGIPRKMTTKSDRTFHVLSSVRGAVPYFLLAVFTGDRRIVELKTKKVDHRVESIGGTPVRIAGGTAISRKMFFSSADELWTLAEGDRLLVVFIDGSAKTVECLNGKLVLGDGKTVLEERRLEREARRWMRKAKDLATLDSRREEIDDFDDHCHDVDARDYLFGELTDLALHELRRGYDNHKGTDWSKRQLYLLHSIIRWSDKVGGLLEIAEELRHWKIPENVESKLPPQIKVKTKSTPDRVALDARRKVNRMARIAEQPARGKSISPPDHRKRKEKTGK